MYSVNALAKRITTVEPIYSPSNCTVVNTVEMTKDEKFFELRIDDGNPFDYQPGQFVKLSIFGIGEAPFSISSSPTRRDKSAFEICVRKVGLLTHALHHLQPGDKLGVRGAFGKPFPVDALKGNDLLIIAGGLGIVPLRSLIHFVMDRRGDYGEVTVLHGSRKPKDRLFTDEAAEWQQRVDMNYCCTMDEPGPDWEGEIGVVTNLIPDLDINNGKTYAIVVGPPVMYRYAVRELLRKEIPEDRIILSLERRMKCGLGKCGHCQIGDLYVCKDGPTFTYAQIKELEDAI